MKTLLYSLPFLVLFIVVAGCAEQPKVLEWQKARTIAENLDHPAALAADEEFVYYVTGGTIAALDAGTAGLWRVKIAGGAPQQLYKAQRIADGKVVLPERFKLALDDKYVYWSSGTLWRTPKSGGESEQLSPGSPTELALDDNKLYWINFAGENAPPAPIYIAEKGSKTPAPLTKPIHASGLAVDDQFIYWTQQDGIYKMSKNGGAESRIYAAPDKQFTTGLASDKDNLYFTSGDGRNSLYKLTKTGAELLKLAPEINIAQDFVALGGSVYFVRNDGTFDTALVKVPTGGGDVVKIDGGYLQSFCVGAKNVFVSDISKIYALDR